MRRLLALLLTLLAVPAWADMFQDSSNAKFPEAQINLGQAAAGNPAKFDPLCDGRTTEAEVANGTAHDCTNAINSAAQVTLNGATVNVQLQPGRYYIKDTIYLLLGQTLMGASRAKTHIEIRDTFNPAATGIIKTAGDPASGGQFGGLRDLTLSFAQAINQTSRANFQPLGTCTSNNAGTGCKYPPAVQLTSGRIDIVRVKIEKAWDGIVGPAIANIRDLQISALNVGLWIDGPKDTMYVERFHFWPWGITSGGPLYGVITDGNTDCIRVGDLDSLVGVSLFCHGANMHFIPSAVNIGDAVAADLVNVMFDHGARLIVEGTNNMRITNMYQSAGAGLAAPPNCSMTINTATRPADRVQISNYWVQNHLDTIICVYAGNLYMEQARLINSASKPSVLVAGGGLTMRDVHWSGNGGTPRTAPVIKQTGGSMVLSGHGMTGPTAGGGGVALELTTDNHSLTDINLGGYGISFGCGPVTAGWCFTGTPQGFYDLPSHPFTMTSTPIFTGTTDFVPANVSANSQWWLRGNKVEFWLRQAFDTNAHTTGTDFRIQTTLPTSLSGLGSSRTCVLSTFQKVAGYTALEPRCGLVNNAGNTASDINFTFPVAGGTSTNVARANIPASTTGFLFGISGWYPIR